MLFDIQFFNITYKCLSKPLFVLFFKRADDKCCLKFCTERLKILIGMANSVDPNHTAPSGAVWSGSTLFAYAILSATLVFEILAHLPYCLSQMIFLPEACDYIGESKQQSMEMAESIQGEIITEYKKLAKELCVWLSVGGFHEKVSHSHIISNSMWTNTKVF